MSDKEKYPDLDAFCEANPHLKEKWVAEELLGMDPARFSKFKSRKYSLRPTPEEERRIAKLLNQPISHVRDLYPEAA